MSAYIKRQELERTVDVGMGRSSSNDWTCDLTKEYIHINADYRT